jgi:hypothetical protein
MRCVIAYVAVLAVTGCATITTGQNQPLSVETPGCAGATCKLSNDKGSWFVSATPGSATVQRAYGDMTVTCEKGDFRSNPYIVKSSTKAMAFGNIIFGGLIGAAVDAGSGAAYDYPTLVTVPMICSGDPKTVVQPTQPPDPTAVVTSAPSSPAANVQTTAKVAEPVTEHEITGNHQERTINPAAIPQAAVQTVSTKPSKHMFAAERLAKTLGCDRPATQMNVQTATSETFTIACATGEPRFIRCDGSECRELK